MFTKIRSVEDRLNTVWCFENIPLFGDIFLVTSYPGFHFVSLHPRPIRFCPAGAGGNLRPYAIYLMIQATGTDRHSEFDICYSKAKQSIKLFD